MKKTLSFVMAFLMCFSLFSGARAETKPKKAVFIIAAKDFQEEEFSRPFAILLQKGVNITVASTQLGEAVGMKGAKARVDMLLKDVAAGDFDAVVFIGGAGAAEYVTDPVAQQLAQDAVRKRKIVGAICIAPMILAKAGLLKGKKATVFPTMADQLKAEGVKYTSKPVEREGRIITADGPGSAAEFGQELARSL